MSGYHVIICKSTNHMLKASGIIDEYQIQRELIPVPAHLGYICNTAIKIKSEDLPRVLDLLRTNEVAMEGHYPLSQASLSKMLQEIEQGSPLVTQLLQKIDEQVELKVDDLLELLQSPRIEEHQALIKAADKLRKDLVGDVVDIRAAIEFSNYCKRRCAYCGISADNNSVTRYRMSPEEIISKCEELAETGIRTVILQSGEDPWYHQERLLNLIRDVKARTGLRITLSVGEKTAKELHQLRQAGVNNYLLKIETANPTLYSSLHKDSQWEARDQAASDREWQGGDYQQVFEVIYTIHSDVQHQADVRSDCQLG